MAQEAERAVDHLLQRQVCSRKSIIRMSIIPKVDYMNTRISIVAHANIHKGLIWPLQLFTAIQIHMCLII